MKVVVAKDGNSWGSAITLHPTHTSIENRR